MANLFDYLDWRGDLPFTAAPFNDIDSLILSRLSYLPFDNIVTSSLEDPSTIAEAGEQFFDSSQAIEEVIWPDDIPLMKELMTSKRFADLNLLGYVNQVDFEKEKQLSALVIEINPTYHYVAFRGTDLSLTGWKEDFNMSFTTPVPAQEGAVEYLESVGNKLKGNFIIGGHSKGGNLAVYAAAFCSPQLQERILAIYNNDGPGFDSTVLETEGYQNISKKIKTFVPQSSVVGMLLQHEEDYFVIHSTQTGLMQHDLYSWQVDRDQFVYLDEVTDGSKFVDKTLKTWLSSLEPEQREEFVDALFSILENTGATSMRELTENWYKNSGVMLKSLRNMDETMRQSVSTTLRLLFKAARQHVNLPLPKTRK